MSKLSVVFVVASLLMTSSVAFAQSNNNSGAGVAGKPGSKSGPAVTKSGSTEAPKDTPSSDQSKVQGLPGSKSGPAVKPPKQ
jgi:hypothetical protein